MFTEYVRYIKEEVLIYNLVSSESIPVFQNVGHRQSPISSVSAHSIVEDGSLNCVSYL